MHPAILSSSMTRNQEDVSEWEYIVEVCTKKGELVPFRIIVSLYHERDFGMIDENQGDVLESANSASIWDIYEIIQELKRIYEEKIGYKLKDYVLKYVVLPKKPNLKWDDKPLFDLALSSKDDEWFRLLHVQKEE